jgi:hypothetical protein
LRQIFIQTEEVAKEKLAADVGLWVEVFAPELPAGGAYAASSAVPQAMPFMPGAVAEGGFEDRYGPVGGVPQPQTTDTSAANEISTIIMLCRGVNLDRISPTANKDLAYTLEEQIKKSGLFAEGTILGDIMIEPTSPLTFTFKLTVKLKRPFKL